MPDAEELLKNMLANEDLIWMYPIRMGALMLFHIIFK